MSFSADGQPPTSAGDDGQAILWNLNLDALMATSCDWLRDYMTNPTTPPEGKALAEGYLPPSLLQSALYWVSNRRGFLGLALRSSLP
ncbi:MAG TPA: hypothetical protein IGR64_10540 [Leptolyngbyaceae cyanobacterium M65_K2018_010]|nr:hypothetical protein [Leptolyngbyaceae cyanobacterium M65_K2018_010]